MMLKSSSSTDQSHPLASTLVQSTSSWDLKCQHNGGGLSAGALSALDLIASTVSKLSLVTVAFSVSTSAQEWGDEQLGTVSVATGWMESCPQPRGSSQSC